MSNVVRLRPTSDAPIEQDWARRELARLYRIEAAAAALVDKVFGPNGHAAKHYSHIKIGAIAPLRDAIHSEEQT